MAVRYSILFLFVILAGSMVNAQRPSIEDFTISGDTYRTEDDCFRLTEERDYSSGSIWYKAPISLSGPFALQLKVMLGCKDGDGADGMVFALTNQANRTGFRGEGIGFGGLRPSIGIEIDTWLNEHLGDPVEDHLAIMANGMVGHWGNNLVGPVVIPNIEDCTRHRFTVRWDPDAQILSVEIDDEEVISLRQDLVNGIFGGNDTVYWGMTAATGRYNNYHEVCFDRLSMDLPLDEFPRQPAELKIWKGDR